MIAGKYRILRKLGAGGMGVVVEAVHVTLGQRVAVKLLRNVTQDPKALSRFLHEARIAAQLPGDHIGRAIDVGQSEAGDAYLVMELLEGRDLQAELAARGKLPLSEAVDWILEACEGVAEVHAVGLVHRDIKPANLFLARRRDGSRILKVLDFGISKWTLGEGDNARSTTCSAVGTPAYMAPEQFELDTVIDARCDQHALAVVLYEMLTGTPPFEAPSVYALTLMISRSEPRRLREILPDVPEGLEKVLCRALSKAPSDRYPDLCSFAEALAPFGGEDALASARNVASVLANAGAATVTIPELEPPSGYECLPPILPSQGEGLSRSVTKEADKLPKSGHRRELSAILFALSAIVTIGFWLDRSGEPAQAEAASVMVPSITSAAFAPPLPEPSGGLEPPVSFPITEAIASSSVLPPPLEKTLEKTVLRKRAPEPLPKTPPRKVERSNSAAKGLSPREVFGAKR